MARETTFEDVARATEGEEREELIRELVGRMSLAEKLGQMSGDIGLAALAVMAFRYGWTTYDSGRNDRLGIPALKFTDGPRGVTLGHSTCFPAAMARGAAWDPGLEERVGRAMGMEARSRGADFFGGICINLLRHPGWGRAQETYGEDPFHLGEMGTAALRGVQENVMGCVKHYACNSVERSRFFLDVRIEERTLREVYLPHFKRCVDAGAAAVMSAYNQVNGEYCGHNGHLLREILKEEWGFDGLVMSDWVWGVRDGAAGVRAGLDVEMPRRWRFGRPLRRAVKRGEVDEALIDEAVARVLRVKARFAPVVRPGGAAGSAVFREHTGLAREAARKGMVLLKNEGGALPLDSSRHRECRGHRQAGRPGQPGRPRLEPGAPALRGHPAGGHPQAGRRRGARDLRGRRQPGESTPRRPGGGCRGTGRRIRLLRRRGDVLFPEQGGG